MQVFRLLEGKLAAIDPHPSAQTPNARRHTASDLELMFSTVVLACAVLPDNVPHQPVQRRPDGAMRVVAATVLSLSLVVKVGRNTWTNRGAGSKAVCVSAAGSPGLEWLLGHTSGPDPHEPGLLTWKATRPKRAPAP